MKVVINKCYGGFSISSAAIERIAKLKNKKCFLFKAIYPNDSLTPYFVKISKKEAVNLKLTSSLYCFDIDNPNDIDIDKLFDNHYLTCRPKDRSDPILVQVVEELGEKANGDFAELKVIKIPDNINYTIEEYDGMEHIAENHRTWL